MRVAVSASENPSARIRSSGRTTARGPDGSACCADDEREPDQGWMEAAHGRIRELAELEHRPARSAAIRRSSRSGLTRRIRLLRGTADRWGCRSRPSRRPGRALAPRRARGSQRPSPCRALRAASGRCRRRRRSRTSSRSRRRSRALARALRRSPAASPRRCRRLAALAVPGNEVQRLLVDERLQNRLHRGRDEGAEVVDPKALQHHQAVLRRLAHGLGACSSRREEQLPGSRLRELAATDHAVLAERAGERECAGALSSVRSRSKKAAARAILRV